MKYTIWAILILFLIGGCVQTDSGGGSSTGSSSTDSSGGGSGGGGGSGTPTQTATYDFNTGVGDPDITTSTSFPWTFSSSSFFSAPWSAQSGAISDSQISCIWLDPTISTSSITFYFSTSTESCCDDLAFYINDVAQGSSSGTIAWTLSNTFTHAPGFTTYKWCYEKDSSISSGSDAVWIDDITVSN